MYSVGRLRAVVVQLTGEALQKLLSQVWEGIIQRLPKLSCIQWRTHRRQVCVLSINKKIRITINIVGHAPR